MSTPDSGDDLLIHVDNVTAGYVPGVNILNSCSLELRRPVRRLLITAGMRLPEKGSSVACACMADKMSVQAFSRPTSVS